MEPTPMQGQDPSMMQGPSLMQRAQQGAGQPAPDQGGPAFQKPDISGMYPPELKDPVARIVAAGMKIMYSPDMRQELMAEIKNSSPTPKKLAEAVVGLLLTMDKQTKGGLPEGAIFPAAVELLGEAAGVLTAAGTQVTQADFDTAVQMALALIGKALKIPPEQMTAALQKAAPGAGPDQETGEAPDTAPESEPGEGGAMAENEPGEGPAHEQAEPPSMERQETDAQAQGLPEPDETKPMRRA